MESACKLGSYHPRVSQSSPKSLNWFSWATSALSLASYEISLQAFSATFIWPRLSFVSASWCFLDLENGCFAGGFIFRVHFGIFPTICIWSDVAPASATAEAAAHLLLWNVYFFGSLIWRCVVISEGTFPTIFFPRGVLVNKIPFPVHKRRPVYKTQTPLKSPEVEVQDVCSTNFSRLPGNLEPEINIHTYILHLQD